MHDVFPIMSRNLIGNVVVHHTHFDRVALYRAAERCGAATLGCNWIDTACVARRAWQQFAERGYGLANIAQEFGIPFRHHDAAEDARVAGLIMLRAIADSGITLSDWLTRVRGPIAPSASDSSHPKCEANPDGPFAGEVLVFTGALEMPRREAADLAAAAGCKVESSITKRTTILVVGDQDVRRLSGHDRSAKHRKAEQLIRAGQRLRIIGEGDFQRTVSLSSHLSRRGRAE
jgi:DNA polymerase-3 subunit epsilon